MNRLIALALIVLVVGCAAGAGVRTKERPKILSHPQVVDLDPNGDGAQVDAFLNALREKGTAGLCESFYSEEGTEIGWCLVTEAGKAYVVEDYTQDTVYGPGGYIIQPVRHLWKNRFRDDQRGREFTLEPWPRK